MTIKIVIPSYKRSERLKTLDFIPESYKTNTFIYVRPEEYDLYKKYENSNFNVVALPKSIKDIGQTMQYIYENSDTNIIRIDDDLRFKRYCNKQKKHIKTNRNEFAELLKWVEHKLTCGFAHCGIGDNSYYMYEGKESYNSRYSALAGYNVHLLKKLKINFNKWKIREDLHVALCLIRSGFPAIINSRFIYDQTSNSPGGCSTYRTQELMAINGKRFQKYHGKKYVRLKIIKHTNPILNNSVQMTIYWKKAFKDAKNKIIPPGYEFIDGPKE